MLDFVCAKAWQTLAMVSPFIHLVWSTKTRLGLSHQIRSSLMRPSCQHQLLPTTIVQLHTSTIWPDISYWQQSSSCTSTTRLTSATCNDRPAAHIYDSTIPAIDITHLAEDTNTTTTNFTCKHDNNLLSLLYLLPHLCFLHCLWLSLLTCFNLKYLRGWRAYRLCNKPFFIIATNVYETSMALDTHRKWLFSLIIVVKVPLVIAKNHKFLNRKFSKIPKNEKFLRMFFSLI